MSFIINSVLKSKLNHSFRLWAPLRTIHTSQDREVQYIKIVRKEKLPPVRNLCPSRRTGKKLKDRFTEQVKLNLGSLLCDIHICHYHNPLFTGCDTTSASPLAWRVHLPGAIQHLHHRWPGEFIYRVRYNICITGGLESLYNFFLKLCLQQGNELTFIGANYLYTASALGIDNYLNTRRRVKEQFQNFTDKFRTKMQEFVTDPKNMVFTEDLKNMVHMAEPSDLNLVIDMIKKFNSQNTEFRFGSFVFGPVVMRMFHFLEAPNEALKCFFDPANNGFFDQLTTYQILLDLLYNNQMYDEMYAVFERVQERQLNMTKYPKYPVVLILAACYKQNTPKSFEYATKLWTDMTSTGTTPLRRACTFFAALALNQDAPHIALESISTQKQHYVTIRNIKASALADMGRVDDALPVLRAVMEIDRPEEKNKHTFFEETIDKVRKAVEASNNKDIQKEFEDLEKALKDRGLIENKKTEKHRESLESLWRYQ